MSESSPLSQIAWGDSGALAQIPNAIELASKCINLPIAKTPGSIGILAIVTEGIAAMLLHCLVESCKEEFKK